MTAYEQNVLKLEAEGMTRSDAQGVAEAQEMTSCEHTLCSQSKTEACFTCQRHTLKGKHYSHSISECMLSD